MIAPGPIQTPPDTQAPNAMLRVVGVVAVVVMVGIDAAAPDWNPTPWSYLGSVPLVVWGPTMVPALGRRILGR